MSSLSSIRSGASLRQTLAQLPRDARVTRCFAGRDCLGDRTTSPHPAGVDHAARGWGAGVARVAGLAQPPLPSRWISSGLLALWRWRAPFFARHVCGPRSRGDAGDCPLGPENPGIAGPSRCAGHLLPGLLHHDQQLFNSQSLLTAAAMLLLALLGMLTALVNAHMPVGRPPRAGVSHRVHHGAAGAPIMAALFMFFPRMAPLWGVPEIRWWAARGCRVHGSGHDCRTGAERCHRLRIKFDDPAHAIHPRLPSTFVGPCYPGLMGANGGPSRFREDSAGRRVPPCPPTCRCKALRCATK